MTAPRVRLIAVHIAQAPIGLRLPFRYGSVTLREAVEARLTVRLRTHDGREVDGHAAETMAPKWFDKTPGLSDANDVARLRRALELAAEGYRATDSATAYDLHLAVEPEQRRACATEGMPPLVAQFGTALLEKAVLSGLRALTGLSRLDALRSNIMGLHTQAAPDIAGMDVNRFLAALAPRATVRVRHTVGGLDPIREVDINPADDPRDGLPVSLEAAVRLYGLRAFKLKLSGDVSYDAERLAQISAVVDPTPEVLVTLDGNEAYSDPQMLADSWARLRADPRLSALMARVAYLEQPLDRQSALLGDLGDAVGVPVIIDESDDHNGAFPTALDLGYSGVSVKSCKGTYRALLNALRAASATRQAFLTAEDLCTQPGRSLEDDLALAVALGVTHVERNGHHFGNGLSWDQTPGSSFAPNETTQLYHCFGTARSLLVAEGSIPTGPLLAS